MAYDSTTSPLLAAWPMERIVTGAQKYRWRAAENVWRSMPGFSPTGRRFLASLADGDGTEIVRRRVIDAHNPTTGRAIEVKVNTQTLSNRLRRQIDADVALRDSAATAYPNGYASVEWHFYVSDASQKVADDPALFDYLNQNGIPFFIHLP